MSNTFNRFIGAKLRAARKLQGITQQQLAEQLQISFQQVQKYESGMNTLSFERVCRLSELLQVPLMSWLEAADQPCTLAPAPRQELSLLRAFHSITREDHKSLLCGIARALAQPPQENH